jgi:predicted 3-demethylubiquinone-9 3-methyltransferase (glyoxalase superfamily)
MQKITPNLWFASEAEDAAKFYTSIFKNSKISAVSHYPEAGKEVHGQEPGSVMTVDFELDGQQFVALNGGPIFHFSEAISFIINCEDQAEVDYFWGKLTADGGQEGPCGWCKDKFGLSWQVVPKGFTDIVTDPDKGKANRAMAAMMQMKKLDLAALQAAAQAA